MPHGYTDSEWARLGVKNISEVTRAKERALKGEPPEETPPEVTPPVEPPDEPVPVPPEADVPQETHSVPDEEEDEPKGEKNETVVEPAATEAVGQEAPATNKAKNKKKKGGKKR